MKFINYPLETARHVAQTLITYLEPACDQIAVAGSIRRGRPLVHDIDLVLQPKYVTSEPLVNLFGDPICAGRIFPERLAYLLKQIDVRLLEHERIVSFTHRPSGIPVEIYLTEPGENNFSALLQMRTGSAGFNTKLAGRAKRFDLYYKAGHGIFDVFGARLDDGSEESIFTALHMSYLPPERRNA